MKTLKRIKLSDLGGDKKMNPNKLSKLIGGVDISLFAGCTSKVCKDKFSDEKESCSGTDVCKSGSGSSNDDKCKIL